jgi:hypothetical protein
VDISRDDVFGEFEWMEMDTFAKKRNTAEMPMGQRSHFPRSWPRALAFVVEICQFCAFFAAF